MVGTAVLLLGGMVGVTSSFLGAGGLTLTVPVLIYLVGMEAGRGPGPPPWWR